jgi:hypothetical protein
LKEWIVSLSYRGLDQPKVAKTLKLILEKLDYGTAEDQENRDV